MSLSPSSSLAEERSSSSNERLKRDSGDSKNSTGAIAVGRGTSQRLSDTEKVREEHRKTIINKSRHEADDGNTNNDDDDTNDEDAALDNSTTTNNEQDKSITTTITTTTNSNNDINNEDAAASSPAPTTSNNSTNNIVSASDLEFYTKLQNAAKKHLSEDCFASLSAAAEDKLLRELWVGNLPGIPIDDTRRLRELFPGCALGAILHNLYKSANRKELRMYLLAVNSHESLENEESEKILEALQADLATVEREHAPLPTILELASNKREGYKFFGWCTNVLSTSALANIVSDRHVATPRGLRYNTQLADHCKKNWKSSRALVLGGSSGSGKSIAAIQAAKDSQVLDEASSGHDRFASETSQRFATDHVVIYLTPSFFGKGHDNEWITTGRQRAAELQSEIEAKDADYRDSAKGSPEELSIAAECQGLRDQRDTLVADHVKRFLRRLFPLVRPDFDRKGYCVTIVLDEIGLDRPFVRGLCNKVVHLTKHFHKTYFGVDLDDRDVEEFDAQCRVRFIVCGTGLALNDVADGSSSESHSSYSLDVHAPLPLTTLSAKDSLSPFFSQGDLELPQMKMFLALGERFANPDTRDSLTDAEHLIFELCTNARCAGLLLTELAKWIAATSLSSFSSSGNFFQHALYGFLPGVVREYVKLNGLSKFIHPEILLLTALAAVTFRLPDIPRRVSLDSPLWRWLERKYQPVGNSSNPIQVESFSLHDVLCVTGGVLVDERGGARDFSHTGFATYALYDAHLAMIRIIYGIPRNPPTAAGLERTTADFALLVAMQSPYYVEMRKALFIEYDVTPPVQQQHFQLRAHLESEIDRLAVVRQNSSRMALSPQQKRTAKFVAAWKSSADSDMMFDVKETLIFEHLKANASTGSVNVRCYHNMESFMKASKEDAIQRELEKYCRGVKDGNAIVIWISADREAFADVVVVGPHRIALMQSKARQSKATVDGIDVEGEFTKMGLQGQRGAGHKYLEQLVKECCVKELTTPPVVAGCIFIGASSDDGWDAAKKKVEAVRGQSTGNTEKPGSTRYCRVCAAGAGRADARQKANPFFPAKPFEYENEQTKIKCPLLYASVGEAVQY